MSTTMSRSFPLVIFLALSVITQCGDPELTLRRSSRPAQADPTPHRSTFPLDSNAMSQGQLLYAPVYSELLFFEERMQKLTAANLSIRNVSMEDSLRVLFVDYYDDHGTLLRNYLSEPLTLPPLASETLIVEQGDRSAGAGANFMVAWEADKPVSNPIVETVVIQFMGARGLAFRSPSRVVREVR